MRWAVVSVLATIVLAGLCLAEKAAKEDTPKGQGVHKGLVVHEWGVFCVHHDVETANADRKSEWNDLPKFAYGQIAGRKLPENRRDIFIKKPVVFFHSPDAVEVILRVDFPIGVPAVWWPGTETPAVRDGALTPGAGKGEPFRFLEWKLNVKEAPKGWIGPKDYAPVDAKHWIKTLREVRADDVFSNVGLDVRRLGKGGGELPDRIERERFVYYDGLLPHFQAAEFLFEKDKIKVRNRASYALYDLTVVDRRSPGHVLVARLAEMGTKSKEADLEFTEIKAKDWPAEGAETLLAQLKKTGLFADEAKSLVEIWKKDFFEIEGGLTLFYRLPQEEYERLLPMKMTPKAEKLVRVGLVFQPHCEPDLAQRVLALVKNLDDEDFQTREKAEAQLEKIGAAAFGQLKSMLQKPQPPETKRRLEKLLEKYDATQAVRIPVQK